MQDTRRYTQLYTVVAYLLKARTVKPAETAISRERLCKHSVAGQLLSSRRVIAETDARNSRTVESDVFCLVRAEAV
jgi:hypothetical protein